MVFFHCSKTNLNNINLVFNRKYSMQHTILYLKFLRQLERISQEALLSAKKQNPLVDNLLSVGPILHIRQDRLVELNHQVTLTIPAPPAAHRGSTHILTFRENNSCTPCSSQYKDHRGYITLQTWHFSG